MLIGFRSFLIALSFFLSATANSAESSCSELFSLSAGEMFAAAEIRSSGTLLIAPAGPMTRLFNADSVVLGESKKSFSILGIQGRRFFLFDRAKGEVSHIKIESVRAANSLSLDKVQRIKAISTQAENECLPNSVANALEIFQERGVINKKFDALIGDAGPKFWRA